MCCMLILKKSLRGVKLDSEERERKERERVGEALAASSNKHVQVLVSRSTTLALTFPNAKTKKKSLFSPLYFDVEVVTNISKRWLVLS